VGEYERKQGLKLGQCGEARAGWSVGMCKAVLQALGSAHKPVCEPYLLREELQKCSAIETGVQCTTSTEECPGRGGVWPQNSMERELTGHLMEQHAVCRFGG
jgi:hypothetical protein